MIVRDGGGDWQVVLQTDHADLSAALAHAWKDRGARHDSLALAAERHDDGWSVWEQAPMVEPESGRPLNFLDVGVPAHLAFYRACIAAVTEQDPYAGLLVSMHGAGIYRQRYGADTGLSLSRAAEVQPLVDAFVGEQESAYPERSAAVGVDEKLRWADYHRLQWFDRFSLVFCLRDWDRPDETEFELGTFTFSPLGPWRAKVDPYPFAGTSASFTLLRRLVPARPWTQAEFRRDFFDIEPALVEIELAA